MLGSLLRDGDWEKPSLYLHTDPCCVESREKLRWNYRVRSSANWCPHFWGLTLCEAWQGPACRLCGIRLPFTVRSLFSLLMLLNNNCTNSEVQGEISWHWYLVRWSNQGSSYTHHLKHSSFFCSETHRSFSLSSLEIFWKSVTTVSLRCCRTPELVAPN